MQFGVPAPRPMPETALQRLRRQTKRTLRLAQVANEQSKLRGRTVLPAVSGMVGPLAGATKNQSALTEREGIRTLQDIAHKKERLRRRPGRKPKRIVLRTAAGVKKRPFGRKINVRRGPAPPKK